MGQTSDLPEGQGRPECVASQAPAFRPGRAAAVWVGVAAAAAACVARKRWRVFN